MLPAHFPSPPPGYLRQIVQGFQRAGRPNSDVEQGAGCVLCMQCEYRGTVIRGEYVSFYDAVRYMPSTIGPDCLAFSASLLKTSPSFFGRSSGEPVRIVLTSSSDSVSYSTRAFAILCSSSSWFFSMPSARTRPSSTNLAEMSAM